MLLIHWLQTPNRAFGYGRCYSETLGLGSDFWLCLCSCILRHYGKHNKAWPWCVNEMTTCIFITKHWKTGKGSHSQCWWCVPARIDKQCFHFNSLFALNSLFIFCLFVCFLTGSLSTVYNINMLAEILNEESKKKHKQVYKYTCESERFAKISFKLKY